MQVISVGISRSLKECHFNYLCDCSRTNPSMCYFTRIPKHYSAIPRCVLELINDLLRDTELQSSLKVLRIDLPEGDCIGSLLGLFTETCITGMLEANNYDSLEMVSPILGKIVDSCCRNFRTAFTSILFSPYMILSIAYIEEE